MSAAQQHIEQRICGAAAPWCLAQETSVGAVVFRRVRGGGVQYLMIQYRHGHWEFPRGHMEQGESEEETMYREIREETGLSDFVPVKGFRASMSFTYTAKGQEREERMAQGRCLFIYKKVHFYLLESRGGTVHLSHEHKNYAWLPFDAALAKLTFDNGRRILQQAHEYITIQ